MTLLRIEEWQNRYHSGQFQKVALEQFGKVHNLVMEQALENALQTLNLNDRELICIQEIQVPVYLRLSGTLQSQAASWSFAIVKQIQQQSNSQNGQSFVRYRSRGHAWISCARAILKGQFGESWAWKQIGIITIDETVSQQLALSKLFTALASEPAYLLPVMNSLWADNLFEPLLLSTSNNHWRSVQEILQQSFSTRFEEIFSDQNDFDYSLEAINLLLNVRHAKEITAKLPIIGSLTSIRHLNLQSRQTIVLVVLALSDPGILCRSPEIVGKKLNTLLEHQKYASEEHVTGPAQTSADTTEKISRDNVVTRFGGLLYLLTLLEHPCGLVDILTQSQCFNQRSMVWVWLHLAITIIPAELDDPVVLIFAGLIPGKPVDEDLWLPPNDAEKLQLVEYATMIITAAQDRLERAGSDLAVNMDSFYQRRAIITTDPGWIEVEFSLNDVDTGIRRAGLDIDPGFLPWIAVVMRFKYA